MLRWVTVGFLFFATNATAADPLTGFTDWADRQNIKQRAVAVMENGRPAAAENAEQDFDLASNSKAITALCLRSFVIEGRLRWDMTLSEALGAPAPDVTLAEVVTHSGGILPDSTQRTMGKLRKAERPMHDEVTKAVLARVRQQGTRGQYAYNNENYALLGSVIERLSGRDYAGVCAKRILAPSGARGTLSQRFGAFAAWGGWQMSAADYARFHWYYFGPEGVIGRDPMAAPHVQMAEDVYYGLGMIYRRTDAGWKIFHAGALRFFWGPKAGAYAVIQPDGTSAAVAYDRGIISNRKLGDLDRALGGGVSSR